MVEPEIKISKEVSEVGEKIEKWNLGKINELIEWIKKKFNIQEQAVVQAAAPTQSKEKNEEKADKVSVKLVEMGKPEKKIQVYKIVQTFFKKITGEEINLKKAMDITKKEDKIIFSDIPRNEAENIEKELVKEETGAKTEII